MTNDGGGGGGNDDDDTQYWCPSISPLSFQWNDILKIYASFATWL